MAAAGGAAASPATAVRVQPRWDFAGQNIADTHYSAAEHTISAGNVARLTPRWSFTTGGSVSATPTVHGGVVYFPDWGGNLWAVNAASRKAVWGRQVSEYTGIAGDVSRLSPAYWAGELVTGDGVQTVPTTAGAYLSGIDARTGTELWKTGSTPTRPRSSQAHR